MNDATQKDTLDLSKFALSYDPFSDLDAARDPRLIQHVVVPANVLGILKETPTVFLAAPGGGKSALRLFTEYSLADFSERSFIINYSPDPDDIFPDLPSFQDHDRRLVVSAATDIFTFFLADPRRYLRLERARRRLVANIFLANLVFGLRQMVDALKTPEAGKVYILHQLGRAFFHRPLAEDGDLQHLGRALDVELARPGEPVQVSFHDLTALIFEIFEAREIFILMDGIDAAPQTIHNPELAAGWILPLLARAEDLARQRVFLKAFLTTEVEPHLLAAFPGRRLPIPVVRLQWDRPLLSSMLRRRVAAASGEKLHSLDGISAAYLHDVEDMIVDQLPEGRRLPREALWLTRQIFIHALGRVQQGAVAQIQQSDLDVAFSGYAQSLVCAQPGGL